jgi:CcmD family protein
MTTYLYAAYCVTWAVIIVYILTLNGRTSTLKQQWDEFRRGKG